MCLLPSSLLFDLVESESLDYRLSSLFDLLEAKLSLLAEVLFLAFRLQIHVLPCKLELG